MKRKAIAMAMAAMMIATCIPFSSAASVTDFTDVPSTSWYYTSVKEAVDDGYMNGVTSTLFKPSDNMTRAMFATVLARYDKASVDDTKASVFTDVLTNMWYTGSVEWAYTNGIISGYSTTLFGTNDYVKRQDVAVMVYRYINTYKKMQAKVQPIVTAAFADADQISDYAKDAMEFCRQYGIFIGDQNDMVYPQRYITRAEAAAVIERIDGVINGYSVSGTINVDGATITLKDSDGNVVATIKSADGKFVLSGVPDGTYTITASAPGYNTYSGTVTVDGADSTGNNIKLTASSGGSSGSGSSTSYSYVDYTVKAKATKENSKDFDLTAIDGGSSDDDIVYHVAYTDTSEYTYNGNRSDNITLAEVAQDFCNYDNMEGVVHYLKKELKFNDEVVIDKDGNVQDITVKHYSIEKFVDTGQIDEELTDNENKAVDVLRKLESGETSLNVDELEVAEKVKEKLKGMNDGEIIDKIKSAMSEGTYDKLQKNSGLKDKDVVEAVREYQANLESIISSAKSQEVTAYDDEGDSSPSVEGGVAVKINPVTVAEKMYDRWVDVDKFVDFLTNNSFVLQSLIENECITKDDLINSKGVKALYAAMDPVEWFAPTEGGYALKSENYYAEKAKEVVNAIEQMRKDLIVGKESECIEKAIETMMNGGNRDITLTDSNGDNVDLGTVAELLKSENPTLADLDKAGLLTVTVKDTVFEKTVRNWLNTAISKLGDDDVVDEEIVNKAAARAQGTYSITLTINRIDNCSHSSVHA